MRRSTWAAKISGRVRQIGRISATCYYNAKMACPYFRPVAPLSAATDTNSGMLPLGGLWAGECGISGAGVSAPDRATLKMLCNLGYARGQCRHFPDGDGPDAVRFTIREDDGVRLRIYYVLERDHHPFAHGPLEFASLTEIAPGKAAGRSGDWSAPAGIVAADTAADAVAEGRSGNGAPPAGIATAEIAPDVAAERRSRDWSAPAGNGAAYAAADAAEEAPAANWSPPPGIAAAGASPGAAAEEPSANWSPTAGLVTAGAAPDAAAEAPSANWSRPAGIAGASPGAAAEPPVRLQAHAYVESSLRLKSEAASR
jgi:hypothetical protein